MYEALAVGTDHAEWLLSRLTEKAQQKEAGWRRQTQHLLMD
jgi:hypothetical protein